MQFITLAYLLPCLAYSSAFAQNETSITQNIYQETKFSLEVLPHAYGVYMRDYCLVPLITKASKQFFANEINK